MKKTLLFAFFMIGLAFATNAQVKVAHTDADSILRALPETKVQQTTLEGYGAQLEKQLKKQQDDFNAKLQSFEAEKNDLPQIVFQERVKELQQMEKNLVDFEQAAQTDLGNKRNDLLSPILEKIQNGIDQVAKENGYTFVLPTNMLLYADASHDITQLVIKKLTAK